MRKPHVPIIVSVVALGFAAAAPAWAEAQKTGDQSAKAKSSEQQSAVSSAQRLKQSLEKAGWKNVRVVDAAYLIHAQTPDGDMVVMSIDPPGAPLSGSSTQPGSSDSKKQ